MRTILIALLMTLPLTGCRGGSEESGGPGEAAKGGAGGDSPVAGIVVETCVECAGLGRSPHSGDERPCFLCDGKGRCAICDGEGHARDGGCSSCDGSGICRDCGGDGIISGAMHDAGLTHAPVPGACPVCILSMGFCPECGGSGAGSSGEQCRFCHGQAWCPECRGTGTNRFCGGEGICPLCRGRGELEDGVPAEVYPPFVVHLTDGSAIAARLLGAPGRMLSIQRAEVGDVVREAIPLNDVLANDVLLAYRLYTGAPPADGSAPSALLLRSARYALNAGPEFLFAARHDALAARIAGASESEVGLLLARADDLFGTWLLAEARRDTKTDPRHAASLLDTHRRALPQSEDAAEVDELLKEIRTTLAAEESELTAEVRERRAVAEAERIRRLARRGDEWRVRAEDLLATVGASEDALLRAHRAAFEAWLIFAGAASRAGPELAPVLIENAGEARALRIRALIALASRLLEQGYLERARSLGVIALALDPADAGAAVFTAEVEGALGRRADEVKDR